jgi:hypothetical protein
MARKGNPISIRLDLNRSSDPSQFSEGDRESHRMFIVSSKMIGAKGGSMAFADAPSPLPRRWLHHCVVVIIWAIWHARRKAIHEAIFKSPLSKSFVDR